MKQDLKNEKKKLQTLGSGIPRLTLLPCFYAPLTFNLWSPPFAALGLFWAEKKIVSLKVLFFVCLLLNLPHRKAVLEHSEA